MKRDYAEEERRPRTRFRLPNCVTVTSGLLWGVSESVARKADFSSKTWFRLLSSTWNREERAPSLVKFTLSIFCIFPPEKWYWSLLNETWKGKMLQFILLWADMDHHCHWNKLQKTMWIIYWFSLLYLTLRDISPLPPLSLSPSRADSILKMNVWLNWVGRRRKHGVRSETSGKLYDNEPGKIVSHASLWQTWELELDRRCKFSLVHTSPLRIRFSLFLSPPLLPFPKFLTVGSG